MPSSLYQESMTSAPKRAPLPTPTPAPLPAPTPAPAPAPAPAPIEPFSPRYSESSYSQGGYSETSYGGNSDGMTHLAIAIVIVALIACICVNGVSMSFEFPSIDHLFSCENGYIAYILILFMGGLLVVGVNNLHD